LHPRLFKRVQRTAVTTFWVDGGEAYSTILGVDNYDQFADWQIIIMGAVSGLDPTTSEQCTSTS
jgi:hypothetical protein